MHHHSQVNRFSIPVLGFLLALGAILAPALAGAQMSPANCTWPSNGITLSSDGTCCFDVVVRDIGNNVIPDAWVVIDFSSCVVQFCPQQPAGLVVSVPSSTVATSTNGAGIAHFCICASVTGPCTVQIYVDSYLLGTVPVVAGNCGGPCSGMAACGTCPGPVTVDSVRYGVWDEFNTSNSGETPAPIGQLLALCPNPRPYDYAPSGIVACDRCFAHTMSFPHNDGCSVIGATLRLHLRTCGATADNDAITLLHHGFTVWSAPLSALAPGNHWDGSDEMTLVLDLCHLPASGAWETNLTAYMLDGSFDVYIQDDTDVDYMELTTCRCCYGELHGTKYNDLNHDGLHQAGEPALGGWTIDVSGPWSGSTTTLADGTYSFLGLPTGAYTIAELNQPGWVNTTSGGPRLGVSLAGTAVTGLDFENWLCQPYLPDTCMAPPRNTVAWYAFDEAAGTTCHDLASNHSGTFVGSPTWVSPGKVGSALHFPGAANYVRVPAISTPLLDFGTGSFAMDAWIRTTQSGPGPRTFLDKRTVQHVDLTDYFYGYAAYLHNGQFGIQVAAGGWPNFQNFIAGPALNDGNWHLVAASVSRNGGGGGGTVSLYTDGVLRATFTTDVPAGSVTNTSDLLVGQSNPDIYGFDNFIGDVDELELMNYSVDAMNIAHLNNAGAAGKCRERCYISHVNAFWNGFAYGFLNIVNNTASPQTYHWSVAGCTPNGIQFIPNSGTMTVGAHGTAPVMVMMWLPPMGIGQTLCFTTTVLNDATGLCCRCDGKVTRPRMWWGPNGPLEGVALATPRNYTFWLHNPDSAAAHSINYRLVDVSSDDDSTNSVARLNGLPPGTPVTGSLTVAALDSMPVQFSVEMDDFQPFTIHEIVLSGDLDGDGIYEEICGQPIVTLATADSTTGVRPAPTQTFTRLMASPNPFQRNTAVQFALAAASDVRVDVHDVLGRLVRTLQSGRLAAGQHHVVWDGRDANGAPSNGGVYFVRVKVDAKVLTTKVVLMQ